MPLYEYECERCGKIEEVIQKFSDKPLAVCSHCEGRLHKLISHSSFHLKGSGWYVTDYAGKAKPGSAPASPGKTEPSAPKSDTSASAGKKDGS